MNGLPDECKQVRGGSYRVIADPKAVPAKADQVSDELLGEVRRMVRREVEREVAAVLAKAYLVPPETL